MKTLWFLFLMLLTTGGDILGQQQIVIPPDGGTVTLQPGIYIGPDTIPTNTHIVGQGALIGDELIANGGISAQQTGSIKTVRILYNHPLVIDRSTAIEMSGVILDFQNTGGLTLDSVSESHFDIGIQHSGESPALTMAASHGKQRREYVRSPDYLGLQREHSTQRLVANRHGHVE